MNTNQLGGISNYFGKDNIIVTVCSDTLPPNVTQAALGDLSHKSRGMCHVTKHQAQYPPPLSKHHDEIIFSIIYTLDTPH